MVRLAYASKDERGLYSGGKAGDQTGSEVLISSWYNRPWSYVMREKHADVGAAIASVAEQLALLPQIGYNQGQRLTLWDECEKIHWNINQLQNIAPCECDCSSMIAVVLRFVGIEIPRNVWTGSMESCLRLTGNFEMLTRPALLDNPNNLRRGDILVYHSGINGHAAVCLDNGIYAPLPVNYYARVNVPETYLQVRASPEATKKNEYKVAGDDTTTLRLPRGMLLHIIEEMNTWGRIDNIDGWVYLGWTEKVAP